MVPFVILLAVAAIILVMRAVSPTEIDDVHPGIPCKENLLRMSDVLWVVPLYENDSIANYPAWCNYILSFNKTLGLHGVYHSYSEFSSVRDDVYLRQGITAFEQCFNITPKIFKAPQIAFNESNFEMLWKNNLESHGRIDQAFHKVYHCDDTGKFPNWIIRLF